MNTTVKQDPALTILALYTGIMNNAAAAIAALPGDHPLLGAVVDLYQNAQRKVSVASVPRATPPIAIAQPAPAAKAPVPFNPADPLNRRAVYELHIVTLRGSVIHVGLALGISTGSARAYMHRYLPEFTQLSKDNGRAANADALRNRYA